MWKGLVEATFAQAALSSPLIPFIPAPGVGAYAPLYVFFDRFYDPLLYFCHCHCHNRCLPDLAEPKKARRSLKMT